MKIMMKIFLEDISKIIKTLKTFEMNENIQLAFF
jgi:hypothetical protein